MFRPVLLVLTAVAANACVVDLDYSGTAFTCESAAEECPDGMECVAGVCRPANAECPPDWLDCAFARRAPLSFDGAGIAEELVAFPAVVQVSGSQIDYSQTNDDGSDVRIVADDGSELPFEIEVWDEDADSVLWVQLPVLPADSTFSAFMYYGNPAATDAQNPAAVWDAEFAAVWHLANPADGEQLDSTSNANHGESSVGLEAEGSVAGLVGGGVQFDGVDDWVQIANSDSLTITGAQVTLEAWAFEPGAQDNDEGFVVKSVNDNGYDLQLGVQKSGFPNFRVKTGTAQTYLDGASVVPTGQWHYYSGVYDGATATVYLDSVADGSEDQSGDMITNTDPVVIGRRAIGDDRFFTGIIDEARISRTARSEAWLAATYRSIRGAMLSVGAEESPF